MHSHAKRIWPSFQQIWSSMPSLNPQIALQMQQCCYQHAFFKVWKTLESAFRAVPALLVFLAPVPEPKSSCRSMPKCSFQVLPNIFGLRIWSSMLSLNPPQSPNPNQAPEASDQAQMHFPRRAKCNRVSAKLPFNAVPTPEHALGRCSN